MNLTQRSTSRGNFVWRWLTAGMCAVIVLTWSAQASALTNAGPGAFSAGATKLTFENLPGDNSDIPPGYASASGVSSFSGATESEVYADYGSALVTAATGAGLGNIGATWGCSGTCGTGFTLSSARLRVGLYLSSNVDITVQVSAYKNGVLLGSQTPNIASNVIGFVGFEDAGGIDQIVIGNNTLCPACIHQMDNVLFENLVASNPIPTLSQWGTIVLCGLLVLVGFALRRRRR